MTINNIKNWQKVCASEDYQSPEFKHVLEDVFKQPASYHRKQWEFVVIYLNLLKFGKLNADSVGASFGAGRERLIYDVSSVVKKLTATDLYIYNTEWATAKIEQDMTCREFVLNGAPGKFNAHDSLDVIEMDMRSLEFDDDSLDFCYSSCAFEHIGHFEDFVNHLKEVKRVLKNGGVYVMTTEHLFNHPTMKVKGNYKFDFDFLLEIFKEADFYPQEEFDSQIMRDYLNSPRADFYPLEGVEEKMIGLMPSLIISRHGIPFTSSCFVFQKSKQQNKDIKHLQSSKYNRWVQDKVDINVKKIYSEFKYINFTKHLNQKNRNIMFDHLSYLVQDRESIDIYQFVQTEYIYFGKQNFEFFITINIPTNNHLKIELLKKTCLGDEPREIIKEETREINGSYGFSIAHKANSDSVYAIAVYSLSKQKFKLENVSVKARVLS
jgi:SAM-dependent methyltransferase